MPSRIVEVTVAAAVKRRQRAEPRRVLQPRPDEVVVGPRVVEPVLLGALPQRFGDGPAVLGEDGDAEAHAGTVCRVRDHAAYRRPRARGRLGAMKATILNAPGDIRLEDVPDPTIAKPTDALVRVTAACVCGSDLWPYRGINDGDRADPHRPRVRRHRRGGRQRGAQRCGRATSSSRRSCTPTTPARTAASGIQSCCDHGGFWGGPDRDGIMVDGGQGEYVRVPLADGTLVATREVARRRRWCPSLLTPVRRDGHRLARRRGRPGRSEGDTVVVVGDGAVGLSGVLAAARMGAERIIAMSRHEPPADGRARVRRHRRGRGARRRGASRPSRS